MNSKSLCYAKSPIPILNSSSPPNYVIMPALLAHVDYTSIKTPPVTLSSQQRTNYPSLNTFKNVLTCSKEIIYKPKRTHAHLIASESYNDVDSMNEQLVRVESSESYSPLQSPSYLSSSPPKNVFKLKNQKTNGRFVKNILINNFVKGANIMRTLSANDNNNCIATSSSSSNDHLDIYDNNSSNPSAGEEHLLEKNYNITHDFMRNSASVSSISSNSISNSFINESILNNDVNQRENHLLENNSADYTDYTNIFSESFTSNDNISRNSNQQAESTNRNSNIIF